MKFLLPCIMLAMALAALFLPGAFLPDISSRSLHHLWESGHLVIFFLGGHLFFTFFPGFSRLDYARQVVLLLCIAGCGAIAMEGLQSLISGKSIEISDLVGDMAGMLFYLSFRSWKRQSGKGKYVLYGATLVMVGVVLWPIARAVTDEMLARYQFPVLADFETPFEASRFEGVTGRASIAAEQAFQGRHSLKLSFFPGPWSGMMLLHFPGNWRGFAHLHFAVYNPNPQPVSFHVRIHDTMHEQGNKPYNELYSRIIALPPGGWTHIEIPLQEVETAPPDRHMDLARISGLGFFVEEDKPLTLYLDTIRLD